MTDDHRLVPEEARAALESAERMRRAGTRRGRAPCWLRATFALALGGFVAAQAAPVPGAGSALFAPALILILAFGSRNNVMARPRPDSSTFAQVVTILGFAGVVGAAAIGGSILRLKFGVTWAPLALGVLVAAAAFIVVEVRTRAWAARQHGLGDEA
jgi:hypothetical protein